MKVTRDQMIKELAESTFEAIAADSDYAWLLCVQGFRGFNNYTDQELVEAYSDYLAGLIDDDELVELEEEV